MLTEPLREGRAWQTGVGTLKSFIAPTLQQKPTNSKGKTTTTSAQLNKARRQVDEIGSIVRVGLQSVVDSHQDVAKLQEKSNKLKDMAKIFQKNTDKLLPDPKRNHKEQERIEKMKIPGSRRSRISRCARALAHARPIAPAAARIAPSLPCHA